MSRNAIRQLIESVGGLVHILQRADGTAKLKIYRQLGLKMTYNHEKRVVLAEVQPTQPVDVLYVSGGGHNQYAHLLHHRAALELES
ncbi:hypothetical protein ACIBCN_06600 [Nocardia sp. NPDC051052]|uniref:hypothetical protein n=1 Tax=Nocardia sp. NPDC051052 TaxID=3364322 RepID=UPI0037A34F97